MKKKTLIIGGVVALAVIILLYKSKSALANETSMNGFSSIEEKEAYEKLKALIPVLDHAWVAALADKKGGDKAIAYGETLGAVAPNPNGKYTYKYGDKVQKVLWPESIMAQVYSITETYKLSKKGW